MPLVHSLVSSDLAIKMLSIFFSMCSPMFPTTYPKIAASGIETQPGSDPSWLLPHVCTHSVHMTEILILFLLYSDIFSMHRPHCSMFPDALIIYVGAFTKLDHDATRNVIGTQSTTPTTFCCSSPVIPRYGEFPCQSPYQSHTIISEQVPLQFLEPITGNTHHYHAN
jgi:hypothetical protein